MCSDDFATAQVTWDPTGAFQVVKGFDNPSVMGIDMEE